MPKIGQYTAYVTRIRVIAAQATRRGFPTTSGNARMRSIVLGSWQSFSYMPACSCAQLRDLMRRVKGETGTRVGIWPIKLDQVAS
jgi:hypothetical protein